MNYLSPILIISFIIYILLYLISLNTHLSAIELVNDMGQGWNLGNTFESYDINKKILIPDEQITLWGNMFPKKEMFNKIRKYGFKTIRFPVTWMNFMENSGKVKEEWMERVKEVVDLIINSNMYCILNIFHDGANGNWLSEGIKSKNKYTFLWKQISEEFKNYDDHLIFESMNTISFKIEDNYDYKTLLALTQSFVDIIRESGGNNKHRLLLIAGADTNLDLTCSPEYKMPIDPSNKLAISIHYYLPAQFTVEKDDDPFTWVDDQGNINYIKSMTTWGSENQYKDMFTNFETMKKSFTDKGIPVILGEVGVLTEQKKEIESIREFLYAEFTMSASYDGIMSCLWDTSNKNFGDMNYYDRDNDKWYDQIIKDNFKKISKRKFINPKDYYVISNLDSIFNPDPDGPIYMQIGTKKVMKVILNANITTNLLYNVGFGIASSDKNKIWIGESISGNKGKKQYDGSYTFIIDISNRDYNDYIEINKWWGGDLIRFNYLTLEFEQTYTFFNFKEYKNNAQN